MKRPGNGKGQETRTTTDAPGMTRRDFLNSAAAAGMLAAPWPGLATANAQAAVEPGQRQRVEAAIPTKAFVRPGAHRRLLIFDLNVGYGGHRSIPTANLAFTLMGAKTGAFETVISKDPAVFKRESLSRFDAVFLNNTVGNLFEDPALRQSLIEFVYGGGGLLGVHGTTAAFTYWPGAHEDWPEFGIMLGARGANHRNNDEHVFIKVEDPDHRLNQPFGGDGFDYRDEFFRVHGPYSRQRVRVLLAIDTEKTDMNQGPARGNCFREDNDYALAWVRQYGRGRVFYCTIAHNPYVFWDPKILRFYLAATQFALGDLPAPTTPSARLTPAIRAQEQLAWRLGLTPPATGNLTLFETIDRTAELGLLYLGAWNLQTVSREIPGNFDAQLSNDELRRTRLKLDAAGVRLLTYRIGSVPSGEAGCRKVFEFARKMGIETFIAEPPLEMLDAVEVLCDEYDIKLAIDNRDKTTFSDYGRPEDVLRLCHGRSKRIGACGNLDSWMRSGVAPVEVIRMLGHRLITVQGAGVGGVGPLLEKIHRLGIKPTMFSVECRHEEASLTPGITRSIELFNEVSVTLTERDGP